MSQPDVVESGVVNLTKLDECAATYHAAHAKVAEHTTAALAHAYVAGGALVEAKAECRHGEWLPWLAANGIAQPTAWRYMRLAGERTWLESNHSSMNDLGVVAALRLVDQRDAGLQPRLGLDDEPLTVDIVPTIPVHDEGCECADCVDDDESIGWDAAVALALEEAGSPAWVRQRAAEIMDEHNDESPLAVFSSVNESWYTPSEVLDAAREVLGAIDLDPASCEEANDVVRAACFYTREDDGLSLDWYGRVWLNPPYGRDEQHKSNQAKWSAALAAAYTDGDVEEAILLVTFSPDRSWFAPLWRFPMCAFAKRLRFTDADGETPASPVDANVIVYFGTDVVAFERAFKQFGTILIPRGQVVEVAQ